MKCQKNRACVKQPANALPDDRKVCTGCDKTGKDEIMWSNKEKNMKKNKKIVNPSVVLDNSRENMLNGDWRLQTTIRTTNNNALELHITNKTFDFEQRILLYDVNLQALCNFGEDLCKFASQLIRQEAENKK